MKTPEELLREFANNPAGLAEYAAQLQQQLAQARQEQAQTQEQLALKAQQWAQAPSIGSVRSPQIAQARLAFTGLGQKGVSNTTPLPIATPETLRVPPSREAGDNS